MQEKLEIGKICNIHGIKGNVKLIPWMDFPEIIEELNLIIINNREYTIQNVKYQKNNIILKLEGVDTVEKAEKLKDFTAYCYKNQLGDLPENTYYIADLIGCQVYEGENLIGVVTDVINAGGADLYEIKDSQNKSIYLPAIKENVLLVDIEKRIINVKLPEGLL